MIRQSARTELTTAIRPPNTGTRTQNPSSRGLSKRSHGRRRYIYPAPFLSWTLAAPGVAGTKRDTSYDTANASSLTASQLNTVDTYLAGSKK